MTKTERIDLYRRAGYTDEEIVGQFGIDPKLPEKRGVYVTRDGHRVITVTEWMKELNQSV